MYIVLSINYSHLVVPMSAEAGDLIALLEKAKVCKENGYSSSATYTVTDEPIIIHIIDDKRVINVPSVEYSSMKELAAMSTRAYTAETERDKAKKELEDLRLKLTPFMEIKKEETKDEPVL